MFTVGGDNCNTFCNLERCDHLILEGMAGCVRGQFRKLQIGVHVYINVSVYISNEKVYFNNSSYIDMFTK